MSASATTRRSLARGLTLAALGVSTGCLIAAAWAYPGGSWADPQAAGFDLFANYWCDLIGGTAGNGESNAGSALLARTGLSALGIAQFTFWPLAARSVLHPRGSRALVAAGCLVGALTVIAGLTPSDEFPLLHGRAAFAGGALGISCILVRTFVTWRADSRLARFLVVGFLVNAALNMTLWAWAAWFGGPQGHLAPAAQKLASVFFLAWAVSVVLSRPRSRDDSPAGLP